MRRHLQFNIRTLLGSVVVLAPALLVPRYYYHRQVAQAKHEEGMALIQTYRSVAQARFAPTQWNEAVDSLAERWGSQFATGRVPESVLDDIIRQVRAMSARSNPGLAEGDLYAIHDLIENADLRYARSRNAPPHRRRPADVT